tara:strand:- start:122 stop:586 length:465 start_codon:yes stop_codon:yes gene_type:complete
MAKYLVETYYTCSFKVSHYLDDIDEKNIQNIEKRDDGKFEILDVKLDNRKTKNLEKIDKNKINVVEKELPQPDQKNSLKINQEMLTKNIKDNNGNKYYESRSGRRWVIYNGKVSAFVLFIKRMLKTVANKILTFPAFIFFFNNITIFFWMIRIF